MTLRYVPTPLALKALADANPNITVSHLAAELTSTGIKLRHGRRSGTTTDRHALAVRKSLPAQKSRFSPCTCCTRFSKFEQIGNRMCSDCRREKSEDWAS